MLEVAKKYILAFPKEKEREILELMEKKGCFEVIENKEEQLSKDELEKELQRADYLISSLGFAISYLSPYGQKTPFIEKLKNPKIVLSIAAVKDLKEEQRITKTVERVVDVEKELENVQKNKKDQAGRQKALEGFGSLGFVPQETQHTASLVVNVPALQLERFLGFCLKNKVYKKPLQETPGKTYLLLVLLLEDQPGLLEFLKECRGEVVPYNFEKPPAEEKRYIQQQLKELEKKAKGLEKELSHIAVSLSDLKVYHDFLTIERTKLRIKKRTLDSGFLNYVLFWAQCKELNSLRKEFNSLHLQGEVIIVETKPDEGENPPVLLENSRAVRPFEYVTEIFGMPRNDELDPTPYLSLFFILFFGICLTDAGYGLLMALLTGLALLFLKNRFSGNKLIKLLFYGGISTMLAGVVFGSYFGTGPEVFGMPFMYRLKMLDPIQDTVWFMGMAFSLGYLQLVFAQVVKIISGRKNKNTNMILSGAAWGLLYIFGGMLLLSQKVPFLKTPGILGVVAAALFILVAESQGIKIFLRPLVGVIKMLQGLIGTMSDILSYSRLMALGLATAVIALIVNQIAGLFNGMIPYVGWFVAGLILIGGHIFNLGINALGAFIHSGRLQFVEFFPKFLEGGGRRLKPTRSELKYIKVES